MSKAGQKIIEGAREAVDIAQKAAEVALIVQLCQEDDLTATRTAYEILDALGYCRMTFPRP